MSTTNVALFGGGQNTKGLIEVLSESDNISISAIYITSQDMEGAASAKKFNLKLHTDYKKVSMEGVDVVIDDSGSSEIASYLNNNKQPGVEFLTGPTLRLVANIIDRYRDSKDEINKTLEGEEALLKIGVMISTMDKSRKALAAIVKYMMEITGMKAGSIALYNEQDSELEIKASVGFKEEGMPIGYKWPLRKGGVTNMILSHKGPLFIEDIAQYGQFDKSQLLKMGVVSLLAIPLVSEGRTMGILYIDDFKPRQLNRRELRLAGLLGMQAAIALDKLNIMEQTKHEALSDELTKLYNHRFYVGKLSEEFNRAKRYHNDLSLCIIDVDDFKRYNDTNGHPKGNKVLADIAAILTRQARNFDIVCRYGGEEFAIILPGTSREAACRFAKRVCKNVAKHNFEHGNTQPLGRVTISVGVASFPDDGTWAEKLEEMADKALYNAKEAGKNRVCYADGCAVGQEE